jgi:hypothetical protein
MRSLTRWAGDVCTSSLGYNLRYHMVNVFQAESGLRVLVAPAGGVAQMNRCG